MLDIVRNNKRITQGFLALITLPFAFWGVDSYVRNSADGEVVATVAGSNISNQELQRALSEQQERMRAQLGGKVDPAMFQTPQMQQAVLSSLVNQRLLAKHAEQSRMTVGDGTLRQFIVAVPALQENGKFSKQRYEALVAAQGMSVEAFEGGIRRDIAMQQLVSPVTESGIVGQTSAKRWISGQLEQREIADLRVLPDTFTNQVKLAADAGQKYYDANRKQFEVADQVRVEYIVLNKDAVLGQIMPTDDDVNARYTTRAESYKEPEGRRASHILITVNKDAPEADVKTAKDKADAILTQIKKVPGEFASLAAKHSQDPGSAKTGGDLQWFGRGAMVKAFEDAAFALKEGETSELVRSDFGFHIIRVTGIRAERIKPLAEVKPKIVAELKTELANKKFSEAVEVFSNSVYEQADSLQPAADKLKLSIVRSGWLAKGAKLPAPFEHPKLVAAVFSDEALKNKRNTEAVETVPGSMVAARVVEHKPATLQTFDAVKVDIEKYLQREEAVKLAIKDGEEKLARLSKGETVDLKWPASRPVSRLAAQGLGTEAMRAIFKADATKLPAYAGVAVAGNGYVLYRISSVRKEETAKDEQRERFLSEQYARLVAEEEFMAWIAVLKENYPVEIRKPLGAVAPAAATK